MVRLTKITIENFKGISKPVTIALRPITLLFGKNSAGKSTILQALAYLHEVLAYQNLDARQTTLGGDEVELGGFAEFVHKKDKTKMCVFRLEFTGVTALGSDLHEDKYLSAFELSDFGGETLGNLDVFHGWNIATMEGFYLEFEMAYSSRLNRPCLTRYTVGDVFEDGSGTTKIADILYTPGKPEAQVCNINDSYLFRMDIEGADGKSDQIDILQQLYEPCKKCGQLPDGSLSENVYDAALAFATGVSHGALPRLGEKFSFPGLRSDTDPSGEVDRQQYNAAKAIEAVLTEYMVKPAEYALAYLSEIRYIGPIRKVPSRSFTGNTDMRKSRWANGLAAWDALYTANESPLQKEHFMAGTVIPNLNSRDAKLMAESEQFTLQKVNEYIRDVLQLGYEVRRTDVVEIDLNGSIMNTLRKAALQFEDTDEQELRDAVLNGLEKQSVKSRPSLYDLNNEVEVAPNDIGVGISQVMPVVVGALAPTSDGTQPSIVSIEQPELHIHPAVQCALGDLFIREKSNDRLFLLETHSEHLLLRIMKRMRQTMDADLPKDSPKILNSEVSLQFIESIDDQLIIRDMPLNERGELVKAWPGGFFEEGLEEVF